VLVARDRRGGAARARAARWVTGGHLPGALVALGLVLASCRGEAPDPLPAVAAAEGPLILVPPEEIAALRASFDREIAANRARRCPRPVLRGEPREGRADEAIDAVARHRAPGLSACVKALRQEVVEVSTWLVAPIGEPPAAIVAVAEACAALDGLIAAAVAHEDACSPYLMGRRPGPDVHALDSVAQGAYLRSTEHLRAGRLAEAADLLLDWSRLVQDVSRGDGAPILVALMASSSAASVLSIMRRVLDAAAAADDLGLLERVAAELGALLDSAVAAPDLLAAERQEVALWSALPAIEGRAYEPPGGWYDGYIPPPSPDEESGPEELVVGLGAAQQAALAWVAVDRRTRGLIAACPPGSDYARCREGLRRYFEARTAALYDVVVPDEPEGGHTPASRAALRAALLDLLDLAGQQRYHTYIDVVAERAFELAALRLHAQSLLIRARTGACPPPAPLSIPALGDAPLRVERVGPAVRVLPPAFLAGDGVGAFPYEFRCL